MDIESVTKISMNLSNPIYKGNLQATEELIFLFDRILKKKPEKPEEYIEAYNSNFFTFRNWTELMESERMCADGLSEEQCKEQIGKSIWRLPCGLYVQYV